MWLWNWRMYVFFLLVLIFSRLHISLLKPKLYSLVHSYFFFSHLIWLQLNGIWWWHSYTFFLLDFPVHEIVYSAILSNGKGFHILFIKSLQTNVIQPLLEKGTIVFYSDTLGTFLFCLFVLFYFPERWSYHLLGHCINPSLPNSTHPANSRPWDSPHLYNLIPYRRHKTGFSLLLLLLQSALDVFQFKNIERPLKIPGWCMLASN